MSDRDSPAAGSDEWTVRRILEWTTGHLQKHGSETPRLDAEILLAHARHCRRIELYTRFDEVLSEAQRTAMRDLVRRRAQHEPVAYLVGFREFYGLDFRVTPDVLVPRPDTETLVMELLGAVKPQASPTVLDVGTGSGCIAVAVAVNHAGAEVTAIDQSGTALAVARENAERHKVLEQIRFLQGDLFAPLAVGEQFDVIASNPPYVREDEYAGLHPDVRLHEPKSALTSGTDGLDMIRRLIAEAPRHLVPGGRLFVELSPEQADAVKGLAEANGNYEQMTVYKDLAGRVRVFGAVRV